MPTVNQYLDRAPFHCSVHCCVSPLGRPIDHHPVTETETSPYATVKVWKIWQWTTYVNKCGVSHANLRNIDCNKYRQYHLSAYQTARVVIYYCTSPTKTSLIVKPSYHNQRGLAFGLILLLALVSPLRTHGDRQQPKVKFRTYFLLKYLLATCKDKGKEIYCKCTIRK
jgi:hypothetical protein